MLLNRYALTGRSQPAVPHMNPHLKQDTQDVYLDVTSQVYKGVLNKTKDVAVKTFSHQGTDLEVIRFNAVSC